MGLKSVLRALRILPPKRKPLELHRPIVSEKEKRREREQEEALRRAMTANNHASLGMVYSSTQAMSVESQVRASIKETLRKMDRGDHAGN